MSKLKTRLLALVVISSMFVSSMVISGAHAQDPAPPPKTFPAAPEHDLVVRVCSGCHVPEMVTAKRHSAAEWDDIIAKMVDHGARADDAQQEQILAYLVRFYGQP